MDFLHQLSASSSLGPLTWIVVGSILTEVLTFLTPLSDKLTKWSNRLLAHPAIVEALEAGQIIQKAVADNKISPTEAEAIIKEGQQAIKAALATRTK